ncbi:hypothetical protein MB02_10425 [Croceicoccus estronivorus]|uniref:maleate cis-trans isomerase family protein n=1 Tax=Croceicoccus estronivorus TaxID=1172626 RepID=UPI00082C6732|nr:hypothetical protein [Croceicoccus estronivorus]OCC23580.1 hypothetical protein MB02_10425 [Croceicoccus estronivorus]
MNTSGYDYGRRGILGIGTPQANPTVEAEMHILFPPTVALAAVRHTSVAKEPLDRLRDYLWGLPQALTQFDSLQPAVFGFACTGPSYLVSTETQATLVASLEQRFGYPIVTATDAITWQLNRIGAKRIALASPYPAALSEAAHAFWQAAGFEVAEVRRIDTGIADTRGIYTLGSADARATAEEMRALPVDAVLLSGTGMPSLTLIAEADRTAGPPLISSNLCIAMRMCDVAGIAMPPVSEWSERLAQATAKPTGNIS